MKLAIAGPDGAGKSSVCIVLAEQLQSSKIIYAGKADFSFRLTDMALHLWIRARILGRATALLVQHFLYYPLEYVDSLSKFSMMSKYNENYIYDRHPIDRVMMKHALKLRRQSGKIGRLNFYMQYPLCWVWGKVYQHFFPAINAVFVLLPEPVLCFGRSEGQYSDLDEARIRVRAYELALDELNDAQYHSVRIGPNTTLDEICAWIINETKRRETTCQ